MMNKWNPPGWVIFTIVIVTLPVYIIVALITGGRNIYDWYDRYML